MVTVVPDPPTFVTPSTDSLMYTAETLTQNMYFNPSTSSGNLLSHKVNPTLQSQFSNLLKSYKNFPDMTTVFLRITLIFLSIVDNV